MTRSKLTDVCHPRGPSELFKRSNCRPSDDADLRAPAADSDEGCLLIPAADSDEGCLFIPAAADSDEGLRAPCATWRPPRKAGMMVSAGCLLSSISCLRKRASCMRNTSAVIGFTCWLRDFSLYSCSDILNEK